MADFFLNLFNTDGFPPRWHCGTAWTSGHGWLHILSDVAIFAAYAMIPIVLVYFILKRRDMPFPSVMCLFAAFILSCGFGHLIEAIIFWYPVYRFAALIKCCTAIISWVTVLALIPLIPRFLALPELIAVNDRLRADVDHRRKLESLMKLEIVSKERLNKQLRTFNDVAVERELRMVELKREVNALEVDRGNEPPYVIPDPQEMEVE